MAWREITEDEALDYIIGSCPACGCEDVTKDDTDWDDEQMHVHYFCDECRTHFMEVWQYKTVYFEAPPCASTTNSAHS